MSLLTKQQKQSPKWLTDKQQKITNANQFRTLVCSIGTRSTYMTEKNKASDNVMVWLAATGIALAIFYGLDHFVMSIQGLPLNWTLAPAN